MNKLIDKKNILTCLLNISNIANDSTTLNFKDNKDTWACRYFLLTKSFLNYKYIPNSLDLGELVLFSQKYENNYLKAYLESLPEMSEIKKVNIHKIVPAAYQAHRICVDMLDFIYKEVEKTKTSFIDFEIKIIARERFEFVKDDISFIFSINADLLGLLILEKSIFINESFEFNYKVNNKKVLLNILKNYKDYYNLNDDLLNIVFLQ